MFGMIAGGIADIANGISGVITSHKNYKLQKEQFEYQKKLQQQMFEREDSAVQRKSTDMAKAGLSKTLAAGGGASAGPVVQTQAPQMEAPQFGVSSLEGGFRNDIADKAQKAQESLINEQLLSEKEKRRVQEAERDYIKAQSTKVEIDALGALYDLRQNAVRGLRKGETDNAWTATRGAVNKKSRFSGSREAMAADVYLNRLEKKLGIPLERL